MKKLIYLFTLLMFSAGLQAQTVADIISGSPDHTILAAAIDAAGLEPTLQGDGPFTVFAPTDAAFGDLPAGTVDALLQDIPQLTAILLYHVVSGNVGSGDLTNGFVETVNGSNIVVNLTAGVVINGTSNVTGPDVTASNGVVHVVDGVLLPPPATVVDIIAGSPDHTTLAAAVTAAGLIPTLQGDGPFTVFAPTDDAFDLLPEGTVEALLEDIPTLTAILTYHVVGAAALSTDLSDGFVATLNGSNVLVNLTADGVVINNSALVTVADLFADNGVVHVIDAVLLPPPATVVDIILESEVHTTLAAAVDAAGLVPALQGDGPFTVFAPTDDAFDLLPEGTVEALLNDIDALTAILTYHVVNGAVLSTDLEEGFVTTLNGSDIEVSITAEGVFINDAQVIIADLFADNGVVHVIDAVLLPPVTVADIISGSDVHTTLTAALDAADLLETLDGPGAFTVFAPTDDAFDLLPEGTVDALLNDIPTLTSILLYHVVDGTVLSSDLSNGLVATLNGSNVLVNITDEGDVILNGNVMVILADLEAANGVVHVVDAVLLPPPATVVDIILESEVHTTLAAAVAAADLVETLQGEGPFTVFAPTDEAFDLLPEGTVDALLNDIPTLTQILLYHAVGGNVLSTDLVDGFVTTINGSDILVNITAEGVIINNTAQVIIADLIADNGVVHVIDAVLLPPPATVVDIITASPVHTTLAAAVDAAGLIPTLQGEGPFTVFAPTDAAFELLPEGTVEALLDDIDALTAILTYHVVGGNVLSTDLEEGFVTTLNGADVEVTINADGVFINDAQVILADLFADNGVVHVIDAVLLPPAEPITVVDIILESPVHTTLATAVAAAGLVETLQGEGPFTVFAPTDDAFADLPAGALDALLDDPTGALTDVLLYHVVSGNVLSTDLVDGAVPTLQGQDVVVDLSGAMVMINDAAVILADLVADNGVVHVIDAVLLPTTNVELINPIADFNVYPNPARDNMTIAGDVPAGAMINIYDNLGRSVMTTSFTGYANINVSDFSRGMYTIMIVAENAVRVKQFMVD